MSDCTEKPSNSQQQIADAPSLVTLLFPDAVVEFISTDIRSDTAARGHYNLYLTVYGPQFRTRTEERAWGLALEWIREYFDSNFGEELSHD